MGPRLETVAAPFQMRTPAMVPGEHTEELETPPMEPIGRNGNKMIRVASRLNLHAVRIKDFKKHQDLGKMLGATGAVQVARGMYLMNQAAAEKALDGLQNFLKDPALASDPQRAMSLMSLMVDILKHHGAMAERIDKSGSKESQPAGGYGPANQPSLPPSHSSIGVMVTVNGSPSKKSDVGIETSVLRSSGNLRPAQIAGKTD